MGGARLTRLARLTHLTRFFVASGPSGRFKWGEVGSSSGWLVGQLGQMGQVGGSSGSRVVNQSSGGAKRVKWVKWAKWAVEVGQVGGSVLVEYMSNGPSAWVKWVRRVGGSKESSA